MVVTFDDDVVEVIEEVADRHRGQLTGDEPSASGSPPHRRTKSRDVRREAVVEAQPATSLTDAVQQQPDLRVGQQRLDVVGRRQWKRLDHDDPFAVDRQRHPARHDHGEVWAGGEQLDRQRGDAVYDGLTPV